MLLEVKATKTPMPGDGKTMMQLSSSIKGYKISSYLLHSARGSEEDPSILCEGVKAVGMRQIHSLL